VFDWEFRDPWFFLLLPLAVFAYWLAGRKNSALVYSSIDILSATPKSLRLRLLRLPPLLLALAVSIVIVALARPRTPQRESRVAREGMAIMMVVDLSSSMNARDLVADDRSINRLDVVKEVFVDFVLGSARAGTRGRPDDLIGLVTFAGFADSICPLTLDHGNLASIVSDLSIVVEQAEDGTAVGDGLGLAVERLRRSTAKSKVAILLTDGVNNAGVIQPNQAAELAAEFNIKVYCIGAGTNGLAPMPTTDLFGRPTLIAQPVEIDEESLKTIANKTGGQYFRAENREVLASVYREIDQLEKTAISEVRYLQYEEHFPWLVLVAGALVVIASALNGSIFRKLP
jgi:Ca-activated chloride channel family protein